MNKSSELERRIERNMQDISMFWFQKELREWGERTELVEMTDNFRYCYHLYNDATRGGVTLVEEEVIIELEDALLGLEHDIWKFRQDHNL